MKKHILSAIFITLASATAQAEDSTAIPFNELDANHDDALSTAEAGALPGISTQWKALDENADGQLTRAEYAAYQMPAPAAGTK
jgi:hypothetical protein